MVEHSAAGDASELAQTPALAVVPPPAETRREQFRRKGRRARLHLFAFIAVGLLLCMVAITVANTRQVELSWVFGSSTASLVWIVLFSAILGWLLGIVSGALFHWRTRTPHP